MPDRKAIRTWTIGATSGLVVGALMGGIIAAATASSPSPTVSAPTPCAPSAETVAAAPPIATATPAPTVASARPTRWTERSTQYASGEHLWFSWRTSMVRWLGGQPVPTVKEQHAAAREGWWGETVNTPPSALAYVASDR
jgi:hypothetical protein